MSNNKKNNDNIDIFTAFSELAIILIEKLIEGMVWIIARLLERYVFGGGKNPVKKIEKRHLSAAKITAAPDSIGYSVTRRRDLPARELDRSAHTLICGASGFGKSVLMETLMDADVISGKPVIFIDPKGDAESMYRFVDLCRRHGRDFAVFSEHYKGEGGINLNPVKEGSPVQIADRIHRSFNWSEEHYENLCYKALRKACKAAEGGTSYAMIWEQLINLSEPGNSQKLFERKDAEGIITRLENVIDSDFGPLLGSDGLSMKEIRNSDKCVYIGLPVLGYPHVARALGKTLLGDLAHGVYDSYRSIHCQNNPVGVYIDELSAVVTDEFIELLNKCRGAGMELTFAFQSPADIDKVSPDLCLQIMENAATWFILKQRMKSGAETFTGSIGTVLGKKDTVRIEDGDQLPMGSRREVHEMIVHPDIIKNLNRGQAVLLQHAPTRVDLVNVRRINLRTGGRR